MYRTLLATCGSAESEFKVSIVNEYKLYIPLSNTKKTTNNK